MQLNLDFLMFRIENHVVGIIVCTMKMYPSTVRCLFNIVFFFNISILFDEI